MANLDNDLVEQAVAALMVRWQLAFDEREEQRKIIREAEERAARLTQVISDAQIGIRAFGLDPNDKEQKAEMNRRYNAAYFRALRKAKGLPEEDLLARVAAPEGKTEPEPKTETSGETEAEKKIPSNDAERQDDEAPRSIKDFVLAALSQAGEEGAKAAAIREKFEAASGASIHEKTIGMTLWRLSREGLVRRDGHTWFSVSPPAKAENPGAGAPGSDNNVFG